MITEMGAAHTKRFPTLQSLTGPVQGQNRVFPVYTLFKNDSK